MSSTKDMVIATLSNAKQMVSKGWIQDKAEDLLGNVCAAQALGLSIAKTTEGQDELSSYEKCVTRQLVGSVSAKLFTTAIQERFSEWAEYDPALIEIAQWNDREGRTQQEVLDTFDHALKLAERDL
jgi:hypothetical protein